MFYVGIAQSRPGFVLCEFDEVGETSNGVDKTLLNITIDVSVLVCGSSHGENGFCYGRDKR